MSHTYAEAHVSQQTYDEIYKLFSEAGYQHAFHDGVIDMHGTALVVDPTKNTPGQMDYWPWCPTCEQPYDFDKDQPFAHCRCGTTEWGHPRPAPYVREPMVPSLETKLATMLWYLEEVRRGRRSSDPSAFESYLDDPEIAQWTDAMKGKITNTRFISN